MSDNTILPTGGGGDTIRTLDKTGMGSPKTEVVALDLGGGDGRSEFIASAPLPTAWPDVVVDDDGIPLWSLSPSSLDALEILFRQTMRAVAAPYGITAAEIAAGLQASNLNQVYPAGNVLRYGADPTGTNDSTPAWNAALSQRQNGGEKIFFPNGLYAGNFVVTGSNIVIEMEDPYYEDTITVGFKAYNTANPVWSVGDGVTTTRSIRFVGGPKLHGNSVAAKGIIFNGVTNCWIDNLIARGFTTYSVNLTASTSQITTHIFINNYRIDAAANAGSAIGLVMTQPADYPTHYIQAVFFSNGTCESATGTLWTVQINANCTLWVANSYWDLAHNIGVNFPDAGGSGTLNCENLFIDTNASTNVVITCAGNFQLPQNMSGTYGINGSVSINGLVSAAALTGNSAYFGPRPFQLNPSVVGTLDFQNTSANKADQTVNAIQPCSISRAGTNLSISSTGGVTIQAANAGTTTLKINTVAVAAGDVQIVGTASTVRVALNGTAGNAGAAQFWMGNSGQKSWAIAHNYNATGVFEITPSTANGGTTFSTPLVKLQASGIAVQIVGFSGTHSTQITDSGATAFNAGFLEVPINTQSGATYTAVLADSGKCLYYNGTGATTFTIPANGSVAYPTGTTLEFVNDATGATNMTIAITTDTLVLSPGGTTGSRTLAQFGRARAIKVTSTRWYISGSGLT